MIIGIGSDLCNIERIQNSLERFGERFELRVFTEVERAKAARHDTRVWQMKRRERTRHLIELGGLVVKAGLVEKSGAWYAFNGERIGQGRENARDFLRDHEVVLTFDDGFYNFLGRAVPLLEQYGATATVYVVSNDIETADPMFNLLLRDGPVW